MPPPLVDPARATQTWTGVDETSYADDVRWIVAILLAVVGSWMAFDGARALIVGDYITPRGGDFAGELGPWSRLAERVGIPPRSRTMKAVFVVVGVVHVTAASSLFWSHGPSSAWLPLIAALTGIWYLPFGAIADAVVLLIIVFSALRPW